MKIRLLYLLICAAMLGALIQPESSLAQTALPLGDGKVSQGPHAGHVWSCQSEFGGGGARHAGEWILGNLWDPSRKVRVQGSVPWSNYFFSVSKSGDTRTILGNGLPDHATGVFPIQQNDPAYFYDTNPNSIRQQNISLLLPANPTMARMPSCVSMGLIGVLKNGVALFNALDAEGRDAVAHETQDSCDGHPERGGRYHYHNLSACLNDSGTGHSDLVGYALDGFGIFGHRGGGGLELKNENLDACHGHSHEILWDDGKKVMYHYHMTREYPYSVGCFVGTPIRTASSQRPPPRDFMDPQHRPQPDTMHPHHPPPPPHRPPF